MAVKEKALRRLADKLNAAGVTWAAGGEWVLCQAGLLDTYHVFDIYVAEADIAAADRALTRLGMRSEVPSEDAFRAEYHFDGADIHVRAGIPGFAFDAGCVSGDTTVLGASVHLLSGEAGARLGDKYAAQWQELARRQSEGA